MSNKTNMYNAVISLFKKNTTVSAPGVLNPLSATTPGGMHKLSTVHE